MVNWLIALIMANLIQVDNHLREKYFANRTFDSLKVALEQLCFAVLSLFPHTIMSISHRGWLFEQFI